MDTNTLVSTIEEKELELYDRIDCFTDLWTQYRSEIAHCGDAWVGAESEVSKARESLDRLEREIDSLKAQLPPVQDCASSPVDVDCEPWASAEEFLF